MRNQFQKYLNRSLRAILLAGLGLYLGYHFVQGEHGILAWMLTAQQIEFSSGELERLSNEREELEHRVRLLRSESLDPDLLEERARAVLNYGLKDDLILFVDADGDAMP
ncbi:uncharacterized protein METZ01_LOCUS195655 [marine metagenome]|uniref:Septum formation initiator n=1 Tax=marine metagenome TaxID=408172 RepID=A0A382DYM0_9ZZZZ